MVNAIRHLVLPCAFLATLSASAAPQSATRRGFDEERAGQPPAGFVFAAMRQPAAGTWLVRRAGADGYLLHEANPAHASGFSMAIVEGDAPDEGALSARLKLVAGARSGGLVWKYIDASNYYAVVLDLQHGEVLLYRVAGGNRVRLESSDDLELDPAAWYVLKVAYSQERITVSLGGLRVFQENTRAARSSPIARAGVMATGDSEVWFDDVRVEASRRDR
jgi:hypothetical protein